MLKNLICSLAVIGFMASAFAEDGATNTAPTAEGVQEQTAAATEAPIAAAPKKMRKGKKMGKKPKAAVEAAPTETVETTPTK